MTLPTIEEFLRTFGEPIIDTNELSAQELGLHG